MPITLAVMVVQQHYILTPLPFSRTGHILTQTERTQEEEEDEAHHMPFWEAASEVFGQGKHSAILGLILLSLVLRCVLVTASRPPVFKAELMETIGPVYLG